MAYLYLDSSAAYKLVVPEAESEALSAFLSGSAQLVSSRLTVVEVGRAARRGKIVAQLGQQLAAVWNRFDVQDLTIAILNAAESLEPPLLRSLDAIQLASALAWGSELAGFVAYDRRLLEAAEALGMQTFSPR